MRGKLDKLAASSFGWNGEGGGEEVSREASRLRPTLSLLLLFPPSSTSSRCRCGYNQYPRTPALCRQAALLFIPLRVSKPPSPTTRRDYSATKPLVPSSFLLLLRYTTVPTRHDDYCIKISQLSLSLSLFVPRCWSDTNVFSLARGGRDQRNYKYLQVFFVSRGY